MKTNTKTTKKQISKPQSKAQRKSQTQGRPSINRRSPGPGMPNVSDAPPTSAQRGTSKTATIEALVRREKGAAITELMAATGWQGHSVRAALTGLRKLGHAITRERFDSETRYRIPGVR